MTQPRRPHVFATMALAAVLLAASAYLVRHSAAEAYRFLPSLDLPQPPLATVPPVPGVAPPRRLARRVIVVLIDGLRFDLSYGRPFLDELRRRGVDARATTHFPSMSRPNHVSILTGVEPRWSGVRTNRYRQPLPLDSVMARARDAGLRVSYFSDGADGVLEMFTPLFFEANYSPFDSVVDAAAERAIARGDELVLLWLLGVDAAGHEHGAASPEYRQAIRDADRRIARLIAEVDLAKDTVIVLADHGHIDRGGHGGVEPEVLAVPLILAGAGVRQGAVLVGPRLVDVAPTISALLGVPAPGHALGWTLTDALELTPGEVAALKTVDAVRFAQLEPPVLRLTGESVARARAVRSQRGAIVVVVFLALAALVSWAGKHGVVHIDGRVLLIAVPSFPVLFYGMIATFEQFLSPSMVPQAGDVTSRLFTYGGVAAGVHTLASWIALRGRPTPADRLAAASALSLVGLVIAVAPAGAAWAVTARPMTAVLPSPDEIMLPPVTYTAVACFAASVTLLMLIESIVFLARTSDPLRFRRGK